VEETEKQREIRLFSVEQFLTWHDTEKTEILPPGWRNAFEHEASVILHTWRQFAA
jgi:hypothetical protein